MRDTKMKRLLTTAALALAASPALAHHPLNGMPMETFTHGMLSGIGHPVLGFDHLFFVALVGIAAAFTGRLTLAPLGYIASMLAGLALILAGITLPAVEVVIAFSLLIMGGVVLSGRSLPFITQMLAFAGFGLFHGWAFGGSIVGQEGGVGGTVLIGYILGLAVIQYLIAYLVALAIRAIADGETPAAIQPRIAGAMVAGIGLFLVMEAAEGPALAAMGLG